MTTSLKSRFIKATSWALGSTLTSQLLRFAANLVMTRLLVPEEFGLMAVVNVMLLVLTQLSDIGSGQAVVYHPNGIEAKFRNTVWTLQIVRGCMVFGLSILASAIVHIAALKGWFPSQSVYNDPRLPWVIPVFTFQSVIIAFNSTRHLVLERALQLDRIVHIRIAGQVLSTAVVLAWGYVSRDVWALVAGSLFASVFQTLMSHIYLPGERDGLCWDREVLDELSRFGRWVMVSSTIGVVAGNVDRIILGSLESASNFGVYSLAWLLLSPLQMVFIMVTSQTMFPALSEVHRNAPERLADIYTRFQRYADVMVVGSAGLLWVAAPTLVGFLYDARYTASGHMLQVLGLTLVGLRFSIAEQLYPAQGLSKLTTLANAMRLLAMVTSIPIALRAGGLEWTLWAIVLSSFAAWPLVFWTRRQWKVPMFRPDTWCIPSFLAGMLAGQALRWAAAFVHHH